MGPISGGTCGNRSLNGPTRRPGRRRADQDVDLLEAPVGFVIDLRLGDAGDLSLQVVHRRIRMCPHPPQPSGVVVREVRRQGRLAEE